MHTIGMCSRTGVARQWGALFAPGADRWLVASLLAPRFNALFSERFFVMDYYISTCRARPSGNLQRALTAL